MRLGLCDAARELLEHCRGATDPAVVDASVRSLDGAAPSRFPWSARRRCFLANLRALQDRDAQAAAAVQQTWQAEHERLELHRCKDGNYQIKPTGSIWPPRWLPALADHRAGAAAFCAAKKTGAFPIPHVFEGVGLGWHILEYHRTTDRVFLDASATLYVIEHHPAALAIAMHLHDWRPLLADPRMLWFIGEGALGRLRQTLDADSSWPVTVRYHYGELFDTGRRTPAVTVFAEIADRRRQRVSELRDAITERFAGRDAPYWADRFANAIDASGRSTAAPPLRILGVTSLHTTFLQFSMRDCLQSLEGLGHETRLLIEPAPHRVLDAVGTHQAQLDFEPDLVLTLSRMRDEMSAIVHPDVPAVCWDQDSLPWVFDPSRKPQLAWNDFLMGYAAATASQRFGWPAHRLMPCSLAGSTVTYSNEPLPKNKLAPYRCDVSYVSHASATVEQETLHAEQWLPDSNLRRLFHAVLAKTLPPWQAGAPFPSTLTTTIVNTAGEMGIALDSDRLTKTYIAVGRVGDRAFRHVALGWVADWADRTGRSLHIWGNGWDAHPRLHRSAKGPIPNGRALRCLYQASNINLQLMGYGFLHQRAIDGLLASGFFLSRRADADAAGPHVRMLVELLDGHGIAGAADLAAMTDHATRREIDRLLRAINADPRVLNDQMIAGWRAGACERSASEMIPHFDEIAFASAGEFEERAERFLNDPSIRRRYADEMRQAVADRYSYDARMRDMLLFVRDGIRMESHCAGATIEAASLATSPA